jgi:two-component system, chemotaxis family, chemotaxis protein CheY
MMIKALIADDDEITRVLLRSMLRQNGIDVVGEARNGADAQALCSKFKPDILFLDINMPRANGIEALKAIKSDHPGVFVIMISSDATLLNVREACALGADNFIVKPFSQAKVMDIVARGLA